MIVIAAAAMALKNNGSGWKRQITGQQGHCLMNGREHLQPHSHA
jgi:hypothetical protein